MGPDDLDEWVRLSGRPTPWRYPPNFDTPCVDGGMITFPEDQEQQEVAG